jgi:membrane protein implicated in regulation of membrane protease activity
MELILLNNMQFVWLGIAVIMFIIEAATMGLTTIWFALGALISMVLAFLNLPLVWQILLFLIASSILLIFTRPVAVDKLKIGSIKTNADSLVGRKALVVKEISADEKGQVKINGQIWTAAASDGGSIKENSTVLIEKIEGVTLFVRSKE